MATTVKNEHGVCRSQWRKWSEKQRALLNGVYEDITRIGPKLFLHAVTAQRELSDEEFNVIAWNAAWTAAHIAKGERTEQVVTFHDGKVIAVNDVSQAA